MVKNYKIRQWLCLIILKVLLLYFYATIFCAIVSANIEACLYVRKIATSNYAVKSIELKIDAQNWTTSNGQVGELF